MSTTIQVCALRTPNAPRNSRPGTSLPAQLRRDLEAAFKHDFASVRIHTDRQAERQTRSVGARAFTLGHDISFAPGAYQPATHAGRRLIAHELTHVVQQAAHSTEGETQLGATDTPAEREAATVADRVGACRSAGPITACVASLVQRQPDTEPVEPPVPQGDWSSTTPGVFSISVHSRKAAPTDAEGNAWSGGGPILFSSLGQIEHFCKTPAQYPVRIRFFVDLVGIARPQPFTPPRLSVIADFTPSGGSPQRITNVTDDSPRYTGAGRPLEPAFGQRFAASSSRSGALTVQADLNDPDTGTSVTYRDTIGCELVPCA